MRLGFTLHRMLRRIFSMAVVIGFCISTVSAQTRTITGKITSKEDGSAIPGVNIVLKGTQKEQAAMQQGITLLKSAEIMRC